MKNLPQLFPRSALFVLIKLLTAPNLNKEFRWNLINYLVTLKNLEFLINKRQPAEKLCIYIRNYRNSRTRAFQLIHFFTRIFSTLSWCVWETTRSFWIDKFRCFNRTKANQSLSQLNTEDKPILHTQENMRSKMIFSYGLRFKKVSTQGNCTAGNCNKRVHSWK